jgi:hypothetical protein
MKLFKAGEYYIGDLCYVLSDDHFDDVLDGTGYLGNKMKESEEFPIFAVNHCDDGKYKDDFGREYSVDSGTIGIVQAELIDNISVGGHIIEFESDFKVGLENDHFICGHIKIKVFNVNECWSENIKNEATEGKAHVYESISHPLAKRIIKNMNDDGKIGNSFFNQYEEFILSMLMFYCQEVEGKKTISELLNGIIALLENINDIFNFHDLFMNIAFINIEAVSLKSLYERSGFNATYKHYYERSIEMSAADALKENGWLINPFNSSLQSLNYRLHQKDTDTLIKVLETQESVISSALNIISTDLKNLKEIDLAAYSHLFKEVMAKKLFNEDEDESKMLFLAESRVDRELLKRSRLDGTGSDNLMTGVLEYIKR